MSVYMRCWLLESRLHLLSKSVKGSILGNDAIQSRSFLRCVKNYKRQNAESTVSHDKNNGQIHPDSKESNGQQIDQNFINSLYEKDDTVDRSDFFKQSWLSKLHSMNQERNTSTRDLSEEEPSIQKEGEETNSGNSFGNLDGQEDGIIKRIDHRDHNERVDEEYPDDMDEDRDWRKNIPLTRYGRLGRKAFYYTKKMTKLGREGKVKEAIEVFDNWMMLEDRVLPSKRTFVTLIGILGRAGYTSKAFQLLREMKHLGLDPPDHVYTSLFNACANCPKPDYGLTRATELYHQVMALDAPPNRLTVMAAMKAFAMMGDFTKAFQILDEARLSLDDQCFNALLLACVTDKESGFRRALKVWLTMRQHHVTPTRETFNLLLRCVRDCGVGDVKTLAEDFGLLRQGHQEEVAPVDFFTPAENNTALLSPGQELYKEENSTQNETDTSSVSHKFEWWEKTDMPKRRGKDLLQYFHEEKNEEFDQGDQLTKLAVVVKEHELVNVSELNSKPGRLSLIGGMTSLISHMVHHGIQPDIRTFTEVLSCMENNAEMEVLVLGVMEATGVVPDVDFLNDIMMRRNMRREAKTVTEVLVLMTKLRLTPNMRTYAAMALTCRNYKEAVTFLGDMEAANIEPSIEVMGHLIYASLLNFRYKRFLLQEVEDMGLKPSSRIIQMVEKSISIAKQNIVKAEQRPDRSNKRFITVKFQVEFKDFLRFYESWLRRTELHQEKDPWERYLETDSKKDKSLKNVHKLN